jgi:hypothetical protein
MARNPGTSGGPKGRFDEERTGGMFFPDNPNWRREEEEYELQRESQLRDCAFRERGEMQAGGGTGFPRRRSLEAREGQMSNGARATANKLNTSNPELHKVCTAARSATAWEVESTEILLSVVQKILGLNQFAGR